jgi:hypothetical protein
MQITKPRPKEQQPRYAGNGDVGLIISISSVNNRIRANFGKAADLLVFGQDFYDTLMADADFVRLSPKYLAKARLDTRLPAMGGYVALKGVDHAVIPLRLILHPHLV